MKFLKEQSLTAHPHYQLSAFEDFWLYLWPLTLAFQ